MSGTRKLDKFDLHPGENVDLPSVQFEPRRDVANPASPPAPAPPLPQVPSLAPAPMIMNAGDTAPSTPVGAEAAAALLAEAEAPGEWVPPQQQGPGDPVPAGVDPNTFQTRLTRKFQTLADSVNEAFRDFSVGAAGWAVELTAPQGMSTGGGKQALQHLRLRPRRPGYTVFVGGTVNPIDRRAELRDFDHVAILHEVRYRHALEISSQEWEAFLRKAEVVLNGAGIQSMRTPPPRELLDQRRSAQRVSKGAIVALVLVLLLASIVVWRVVVALTAG